MRKKYQKSNFFKRHILENYKTYIICFIIFIMGILFGVTLVNSMTETNKEIIHNDIINVITLLKDETYEISTNNILKKSLTKNLILVLIIWILGLSFFGKYFLSIMLFILGVNFGYSISCITTSLEFKSAIIFIASNVFLHNLIFLPSIFFLILQGIIDNNYHKIYSNRKYIYFKFTCTCIIVLLLLINSSFVETYVTTGFLKSASKYF